MGALTLKPFSDESREWELIENESVDISDGFGVPLRASVRENRIFLVEPNNIDMPWLTDRGRLFFEGAFSQEKTNKKGLDSLEWADLFERVKSSLYFLDHCSFLYPTSESSKFFNIVFKRVSVENLDFLQKLENKFSFVRLIVDRNYQKQINLEESYQLTADFDPLKLKFSSLCLLIGINTRYEGYVLNLILRQRFLKGGFAVMSLGPSIDLTIPSICLGSSLSTFLSLCEGTLPACRELSKATNPLFLTNNYFFKKLGSFDYLIALNSLKVNLKLAVMSDRIESTGISDLSKYNHLNAKDLWKSACFYYLNMDLDINSEFKRLTDVVLLNSFGEHFSSIRQTSSCAVFLHSEDELSNKKVLTGMLFKNKDYDTYFMYYHLPAKGFFGEDSTYKSIKGVEKKSAKIIGFQNNVKSSWQLLRYLYFSFSKTKFFAQKKDEFLISEIMSNALNQKNYHGFLYKANVSLTSTNYHLDSNSIPFLASYKINTFKLAKSCFINFKIKYWLDDFFIGGNKDSLSSKSPTLIKCSSLIRSSNTNFF